MSSYLMLFLEGLDAEHVGLIYFQGFVRRRDQVSSVRIERFVGTEDRQYPLLGYPIDLPYLSGYDLLWAVAKFARGARRPAPRARAATRSARR